MSGKENSSGALSAGNRFLQSMPDSNITDGQMRRLQTLWGQYARHELIPNTREERLSWTNENLKNRLLDERRSSPITSFNELTLREASGLINALQAMLGIKETSPAAGKRRYRSRITDRDLAHAAGTEGRRGYDKKVTLASAEDLQMIDRQLSEMDWDRARLDALLRSPSSPLGRRSNPEIQTIADVNRVLYAVRGIARRQAART